MFVCDVSHRSLWKSLPIPWLKEMFPCHANVECESKFMVHYLVTEKLAESRVATLCLFTVVYLVLVSL